MLKRRETELHVLKMCAKSVVDSSFVESKVEFRDVLDSILQDVPPDSADWLREEISSCPQKWFLDYKLEKILYVGGELVVPVGTEIVRFSCFAFEERVHASSWEHWRREKINWTPFTKLYREAHGISIFFKGFCLAPNVFSPGLEWMCFPNDVAMSFRERAVVACGFLDLWSIVSADDREFFPWGRPNASLKEMSFESAVGNYFSTGRGFLSR